MSEEQDFDIDAGVADIADSMGFSDGDYEENEEEVEETESEASDDKEEGNDKGEDKQQEVVAKPAPASWAKERHETWSKLPDDAKEYIQLREEQMSKGHEQLKDGYKWGEYINKTIEPFRDILEKNGVDEGTAISNLFMHHRVLTEGSIESRQQAFINLGMDLGIIPQDGQRQQDPQTVQMQQRLDRMERLEHQRLQEQQNQHYSSIAREVEDFASKPENIYFDELADDIILMINAGMDLKTAYDKAVWANPITRAKEQDRAFNERQAKAKAERNKSVNSARKVTSNTVRSKSRTTASLDPSGSWDDTMRDVLRSMGS